MLNPLSWPGRVLTLIGLVVVVAVALVIVYFTVIRGDAPPPVTIQSAVESLDEQQEGQQARQQDGPQAQPAAASSEPADEPEQQQAATAAEAGDGSAQDGDSADSDAPASDSDGADEAADAADEAEAAAAPTLADLAGTWMLSAEGQSFVGYRIGETFADIGTATAVGRTSDLSAELDFDGARITRVAISADLRTLRSDQSRRDQALRTRGLETDRYPTATFTLSEPIAVDEAALSGDVIERAVRGTLELHGVANEVEIALTGQLVDGLVVIVGSSEIALADYEIEPPTNFRVVSIEDSGTMEFQIILARR